MAEIHTLPITHETENISLSGMHLETLLLTALRQVHCSQLKEITLAANSLQLLDLTPLSSCPALTVLKLNSNRIPNIDLSPLASCPKLERLWLHDNCLQTIDLSPLTTCKPLRSLYLEDNSLHSTSVDLSPLSSTQNLRSLRLGGNRLGGTINLTPLFQCPTLSILNIDTSVQLIADGDSKHARVSPALRKVLLDIKFTGKPVDQFSPRANPKSPTSLTSPTSPTSPTRGRRKVSPPAIPASCKTRRNISSHFPTKHTLPSLIVKVLLLGFRRLARYAVEDSFSKCGKTIIRAADQSVASDDPSVLLDSHLVLLYAPSEKTLRQVTTVVGRIPTSVIGTERYRSTADNRMLELLDSFNFYADPIDTNDTQVIYDMARNYATGRGSVGSNGLPAGPSSSVSNNDCTTDASPISEEGIANESLSGNAFRKSHSDSALSNRAPHIEIENIEDDVDVTVEHHENSDCQRSGSTIPRSRSTGDFEKDVSVRKGYPVGPATTWSEVTRRLKERRSNKVGRGWGSYVGSEMGMHGRNKLRAEHASVENIFFDLGGYAVVDTCSGIAKSCGLPKCSGPLLFSAAFGSLYETEATTPEAGVQSFVESKRKRLSFEVFIRYWDSRLKTFDGEERLSNILEDSHFTRPTSSEGSEGHSPYGAPYTKRSSSPQRNPRSRLSRFDGSCFNDSFSISPASEGNDSFRRIPSDLSCPCDAGIESLITSFMNGRSSRFGSFALVKMTEAIAIGSALVMYGLRGVSNNRVGGRARPVCPKEVREGKLNAALIAAEVGIFEGVASGLSMEKIRSVKGTFSTEASHTALVSGSGMGVNNMLSLDDVQRFCTTRKTLLPGAVKLAMAAHCRSHFEMALSEFSVLLSAVNNISSNGAADYFFTVVDVDQDELWTLPDLRQFHMEKEQLWLDDGMAVCELSDMWLNLMDMIRPKCPQRGITRKEFRQLGSKERKVVLQSLLFIDDNHSLLNIRRTMDLSSTSASSVMVM